MGILDKFKKSLGSEPQEETEQAEEYVELDALHSSSGAAPEVTKNKVTVRPFVIDDFADVKPVLDALREGYTIVLVNIRPLKDKDLVELKRAINKLKKTCDAIEGDIAGFGDDYLVITPSFAEIYRSKATQKISTDDSIKD